MLSDRIVEWNVTGAIANWLSNDIKAPFVTAYDLASLFFALCGKGHHNGIAVNVPKQIPTRADLSNLCKRLLGLGILQKEGCPVGIYRYTAQASYDSVYELAYCADPVSCISHLSAMEYHGLTNRLSKIIFTTTLSNQLWRGWADLAMLKTVGEKLPIFLNTDLPKLRRINVRKFGEYSFKTYQTQTLVESFLVPDRAYKMARVEGVFFDMVREPGLCGGMGHVVDTFREHGARYAQDIIRTVSLHGKPIHKARVGYLLESIGVESKEFPDWLKTVTQGSSRVLDPTAPFNRSSYSERWQLSLNTTGRMDD